MAKTKIEWTERTWNPVTGCSKVSDGCKFCYAETIAKRFWKDRKFTDVQCHEDRLNQPLHWRKPSMVFVNSMSDLFHESVSFGFISSVYETIMHSPNHTYQILTKRPHRALEYYNTQLKLENGNYIKFPNLWLGVSVENQKTADERIPLLLQIPAAVRFISYEPALEYIDNLYIHPDYDTGIDWVIIGCESGLKRRPAKLEWFEKTVVDCKSAGVSVFVKQMEINGKVCKDITKFPKHLQIREFPKGGIK